MKLFSKIMLLAAFMIVATTVKSETLDNKNLEEIQAYLSECGAFFIATADGDQPRVRPFGVAEIYNGRLYIMTGKKKNVFKQIAKNGKFEICALKKSGTEWIRISGKLISDDDVKVKEYMLEKNPSLKNMYSPTDDNMAVLYIVDGEASFNSFTEPERKVKF